MISIIFQNNGRHLHTSQMTIALPKKIILNKSHEER